MASQHARGDAAGEPGSEGADRGRAAEKPTDVPKGGWIDVLTRTKAAVKRDHVTLLSAGVAFYALLALVPALVALVSVYGLVADPADVERQVSNSLAAAPEEVRNMIEAQLRSITEGDSASVSLGAIFGVLVALWSASSGVGHLMTAVNAAYNETETRGFVKRRAISLAFTLGAILFVVVAIATLALLPPLLARWDLADALRITLNVLRWPLLGLGLLIGLALLYRFAPNRDDARWSWVSPGAIVATVLWLVASALFSVYTANFGNYNETYGSLGAVIVVMLWLFISAFVVVLGAELNSELERQTRRDTTVEEPRPMGDRDAYSADTLGPTRDEQKAGRDGRS
jgi:membrane protein